MMEDPRMEEMAKDMPFVDASRMAGVGASYGGYLMAWFEGNTDRFKCLVNHDGVFDLRGGFLDVVDITTVGHINDREKADDRRE